MPPRANLTTTREQTQSPTAEALITHNHAGIRAEDLLSASFPKRDRRALLRLLQSCAGELLLHYQTQRAPECQRESPLCCIGPERFLESERRVVNCRIRWRLCAQKHSRNGVEHGSFRNERSSKCSMDLLTDGGVVPELGPRSLAQTGSVH